MRICVDATPLLFRSAGVKTYVYHWLAALRQNAGNHQVTAFPLLNRPGPCVHDRSVVSPLRTLAGLTWLHMTNFTRLPLLNPLGARVDVFHSSHQLQRPPRNTRLTATLYDMTCWLVPELHSPANVKGVKSFGERVLRRADSLLAISASTRDDAVKILGLPPEKVEVIYPGVAPGFFEASSDGARRLGLTRPYALCVGTIEPRKNVATLLDAWRHVPARLKEQFDLVVAGPYGWGGRSMLERLKTEPGVRYLGYVAEEELPALTAGAAIFVYPSLYEGFGLPVAQAMAAGVPVVTSNVSSLPEVAADAGLLVDPRSVSELASAVSRLLDSPPLRADLAAKARRSAGRFRWEVCAERSWRWLERVVA